MTPTAGNMKRHSTPEAVAQQLREMVSGPDLQVGDRLVSMRELSKRLGASLPTVQRALDQLQDEGLVEKRHGSGVYVTGQHPVMAIDRCVTICSEGGGHVWGEMTAQLMRHLQSKSLATMLVDTSFSQPPEQIADLLASMCHSPSPCMLVHGHRHFPFDTLMAHASERRPVVALVEWESSQAPDQLTRVLSDAEAGGRIVAEHLLELGHRRVIVAGPKLQVYLFENPDAHSAMFRGFRQTWEAAGGSWATCQASADVDLQASKTDVNQLKRIFRGKDAPTAIFGLMDVAACDVLHHIRQFDHALADRLAVVGYYDTPWSQAAHPAMTSVNLDIPAIVRHACAVVDAMLSGKPAPFETRIVEPRLMIRQTSRPCK